MKRIALILTACWVAFSPVHAQKKQKTLISVETAGTQLIFVAQPDGVLSQYHFGAKLAWPEDFLQYQTRLTATYGFGPMAYPTQGGAFWNEPALAVRYADGYRNTELRYVSHTKKEHRGVATTDILLQDDVTRMQAHLIFDAYQKENVITARTEITNAGKQPVTLISYASSAMNLDAEKYLLTHTYGDWGAEMQVEREVLTHHMKVIESKRGTQTSRWGNPSFMLSLDTESFSETEGEVIAGSLAWSGNYRLCFEKEEVTHRLRILAGINPFSSEYPLAPGETFATPEMIWTWSGCGAGGASRNLHAWARNWGVYGGKQINPTLLNSWEGAYFTFTTQTLTGMIDDAAAMGLEMFVLDDGWFATKYPRNNDKQGLGDWEPNLAKIPEGIDYLASYAHDKGLKFGIWIEPEMANPKSRLAEEHPDWIVRSAGREIPQQRNQWILDLTNPAVQDFVYGVFDNTMKLSSKIDYIKWDCNRPVMSVGSDYLGTEQSRFYVDYIQGLYKIMRRIREKYPDTIIQCCSSGGSRVDYGSLKYFNEYWASDDTDAMERVNIQYGTSLFYPAGTIGSHVSAVPNHQTGNITPLKFRFDIACSGRLGMELQPKNLTPEERAFADRCIQSYKGYRDLVFFGDLYRLLSPYDGNYYALMYVAPDKSRAVVFTYCTNYLNRSVGGKRIRLQGLDPARRYQVTELNVEKSCYDGNGKSFHGEYLMNGGFNPVLFKTFTSAVFLLEAQ